VATRALPVEGVVRRYWYALAAAGALAGTVVLLLPSRRIAPERHLPVAERMPEVARAALTSQMHSHARGMMELVSTVTVLDYEAVQASVGRLIDEPRVARPLSNDASALQLPERFFELQDELRRHLEGVRRAAVARDSAALSDAFGAAANTCVRCHDAYLKGR
jgi:hypothetical protein